MVFLFSYCGGTLRVLAALAVVSRGEHVPPTLDRVLDLYQGGAKCFQSELHSKSVVHMPDIR